MKDYFSIIRRVENMLMDDESKDIFNARLQYSMYGMEHQYMENIGVFERENPICREWKEFSSDFTQSDRIVIFGAGTDGSATYKLLSKMGYGISVIAFCDNNMDLWGTNKYNIPIISIDVLKERHFDAYIVIATEKYVGKIYSQLLVNGFRRERILYPSYSKLIAQYGNQYFDLPQLMHLDEKEVFIDAGGYDGATAVEFAKWSNQKYKEIYIFEPDKINIDKCDNTIKTFGLYNTHIINKGTYSSEKELFFKMTGSSGGSLSKNGKSRVLVTSIDKELNGKPTTFIKMDVEGSELDSLIGAQETIRKFHPKLAICVYHKPWDIIEIPEFIMSLDSSYRFYLRHYTSCFWETVLYAI